MTASTIAQTPREAVEVEARKPLTRREYLHLCIAQNGRCGCGCGVKLEPMGEGVIDEHVVPLEYGREGANELTNRALYRKPCAAKKTAEQDAPGIAKAKRLAGETNTGPKTPIPQRVNPWPPKGSQKFRSRGPKRRSPTP